ncbi:MAG: hypothetical protein ACFCVK_03185 [Acidimicrobiales bacterium]
MRRTTSTWANVASLTVLGVAVAVGLGFDAPGRPALVDTVGADTAIAFDPGPEESTGGGAPVGNGSNTGGQAGQAPAALDLGRNDPAGPTAVPGTNVVRFVYFVEADEEVDPVAVELIEQQSVRLQQFWFDQFGGTFRLPAEGVEIIYGEHEAAWYDTTVNGDDPRWYRLMNLRTEVRAILGMNADDTTTRLVVYPSARIDGRVGANRYGEAWMDGDDITCISGAVATTPYTVDFPADCLGTVAHELGHVYGLDHRGDDDDCMQFGFYQYKAGSETCSFSEENRRLVTHDPLNAGWLDAVPGDRA